MSDAGPGSKTATRRRHLGACALALAMAALTASSATADELRLSNGDRYTGTVVQLAGGTLTFRTPHGTLSVPWTEVIGLTVDDPIIVKTLDAPEATVPGGEIDIATTASLTRPVPAVVLTGGVGAGFVATSGNTSVNSLRVDGDAVLRMHDNRYTFAAGINRAEDRGATTAQNWTASGRYDRFVTPRIFVNGNAIFTNDRFRDLDLRTAVGGGLGYQIVDRPAVRFNLDAGVGYVNEDYGLAEDNRYAALRESGKLDVVAVPDRLVVFHQHDGYFGVTGDDNLFVQAQNGLRITLVGGLITTLRLDLDYVRKPAPGRANVDRTTAVTLGYRF